MPKSSPPSGAAEMAIPAGRACRALSSFSISGRCRRYAQTTTTFQRDRGEHSFGRPMRGDRPVFLFPPFSAGEPKTPERVHLRRRESQGEESQGAGIRTLKEKTGANGWSCRREGARKDAGGGVRDRRKGQTEWTEGMDRRKRAEGKGQTEKDRRKRAEGKGQTEKDKLKETEGKGQKEGEGWSGRRPPRQYGGALLPSGSSLPVPL